MCGIVCSIRPLIYNTGAAEGGHEDNPEPVFDSLVKSTSSRGPDAQNTYKHVIRLDNTACLEVKLSASVLGLRGETIVSQPVIGKRGVLAWNGQV